MFVYVLRYIKKKQKVKQLHFYFFFVKEIKHAPMMSNAHAYKNSVNLKPVDF